MSMWYINFSVPNYIIYCTFFSSYVAYTCTWYVHRNMYLYYTIVYLYYTNLILCYLVSIQLEQSDIKCILWILYSNLSISKISVSKEQGYGYYKDLRILQE